MGTAAGLIAEARTSLGTVEHPPGSNHNNITVWYNAHVAKIGDGPWCDMSVTMWGELSDNGSAIGRFAYTVAHADWFASKGRWHTGTAGIKPGDVVFFDWGGTRSRDRIDHVGVVEKVAGGKVYTIEGNSGDVCRRVVRDSTYIVGYGRPAYSAPAPAPKPTPAKTEDDMPYGQLAEGPQAITPIALPKGRYKSIGFTADNGLQQLPAAHLRVAIHHGKGAWKIFTPTVDSKVGQAVVTFPTPATTDGISVRREDGGDVHVAWEVS